MNVSLTPQLEAMVRQKVEAGLYNNASEVVREALRLLDARDQRLYWLRSKMATAEEQVKRGEVVEFSEGLLDELDREVDERLRLLDARDRRRQQLRDSVAEGLASIERGDGIELPPELFDELSRQAEERACRGEQPHPDVCP